MDFRSDNVAGAHPAIVDALIRSNGGSEAAYGADAFSLRLARRFCELFEREVTVLPVATGTAANALALATYVPPWGAVYCHAHAHVNVDECGAPELFTGGAKLIPIDGENGKLTAARVSGAIRGEGFVHAVQPAAISLSQSTESGTVYTPSELESLSDVARRHRMILHVDGARFANAVVSLNASPAELTWKAGVDVLSFGGTKNGCFAAEAIVLFSNEKAQEAAYRRKRGGHLLSKMRLVSAQLEAYLEGDLWLSNARHANVMAARLARGLAAAGFAPLVPVEANEIFAAIPDAIAEDLRRRGFLFYDWPALGAHARRLVTAFDTREEHVDALVNALPSAPSARRE